MLKAIQRICAVATLLSAWIFTLCILAESHLPDQFYVSGGEGFQTFSKYNLKVVSKSNSAAATSSQTDAARQKEVELKLFGLVPVKTATVTTTERMKIVPSGIPFGVKIFTNGVMIVGMTEVDTAAGLENPAKKAGLKEGDVILSINGLQVFSNRQVAAIIEESGAQGVTMEIHRNGAQQTVNFIPAYSLSMEKFKAGLWVRDSSAGIGTLTFYEPQDQLFGGLGHGICDVDTGELLPLKSGEIIPAEITDVIRGASGAPGELCGYFRETSVMGELNANSEVGVYGRLFANFVTQTPVEVAFKQEVQEGPAQILATISGHEPAYYDIVIKKIHYKSDSAQKNMVIEVTDSALLQKTGGIVQGMSGSPILQNGRLVGAVTHVFVNDPTQGYAIFAENMIMEMHKNLSESFRQAS